MNAPTPSLAAELGHEFTAALQWWRDAGVDHDYTDDVTDWLAEPERPEHRAEPKAAQSSDGARETDQQNTLEASEKKQAVRANLLGDDPPADLAAFQRWWLEAPGLDAIGPRGRVPPRGVANAELMVLVIDPEERDDDQLLSGPQGKLLSNILTAIGISEEQTYFASALPRHTPMADTANLASGGMDAVVAHHIALAAPKRILAFGTNISPLIGHELTKDLVSLREINKNLGSVPFLQSEGLDSLMGMPQLKARFWRRWIEWSAD